MRKPKQQILVADDDPVTVQMLSGLLEGGGFEVEVAFDAMQAVMKAMRRPPDAVILDIGMPGGGGFQVLQRLKAIGKLEAVPVIVVTALDDPALPARVRALGAKEFLKKPVSANQLRDALDRTLNAAPDEQPRPAVPRPKP